MITAQPRTPRGMNQAASTSAARFPCARAPTQLHQQADRREQCQWQAAWLGHQIARAGRLAKLTTLDHGVGTATDDEAALAAIERKCREAPKRTDETAVAGPGASIDVAVAQARKGRLARRCQGGTG